VEEKKADAPAAVDEWKAHREAKKLADRADWRGRSSAALIDIAAASLDDAEQATLEATIARFSGAVAV
jgi:hypothetical protein